MAPRCEAGPPVPGYGDPAGDVHLIGDHPSRHGGRDTGVPFTDHPAGRRIQKLLYEVGLLEAPYADEPVVDKLFLSYLHMCPSDGDRDPSPKSYARLERFFDAELRAVNAHILLPVGRRATDAVLTAYTTQAEKVSPAMADRHATEIRGRGFLVIPIRDPTAWMEGDRVAIRTRLEQILASDYRQTKGVATLIG